MKKLFVLFMLLLAAFAGCKSGTGNDKGDKGNTGNNPAGNGGTFKVSGSVKLNHADGAGILGATVKLAGVNTNLTVNSDANGNFAFSNITSGAYAVTAVKANYTFTPSEVAVTVDGKDAVVQTFVGVISGGNAGSGGTHNFFPMKPGATWTFESKLDDSDYYSHTYIEKIVGSTTHGGKTYWVHETSFPSEYFSYADTTLYRIENNVLYGFFSIDMFFKSVPKAARDRIAKAAAKSAITPYGNEMAILKFGQSPGTTWTIYDTGVFQGNSMKATGKFLGTENVNVPAGNFTGCAKFEIVFVTTNMDSETNTTYTYTEITTMWYAPGVGNVKNIEVESDYSDTENYTTTDVLKSYVIP